MGLGEIIKETNTYSEPSHSAIKKDFNQKVIQVEGLNIPKGSPNRGSPIHLETEVQNESMSLPDLYLSSKEPEQIMKSPPQIKWNKLRVFFRRANM